MIIAQNYKDTFTTSESQDKILKDLLDYIALDKTDLAKIVNIIYHDRNIPTYTVLNNLCNAGYEFFTMDDVDIVMRWFSTHTDISLVPPVAPLPEPSKFDPANCTQEEMFAIMDGMNDVNCKTQEEYESEVAKGNPRNVSFNLDGEVF